MLYEGSIYRPPSEANSLILQVTLGCKHNLCTFCGMYKDKPFRIKSREEIAADVEEILEHRVDIRRIFLADGDALCLPMEDWRWLLPFLYKKFPILKKIAVYATPADVLKKSVADLKELRDLGLDMIYLGVESGAKEVLRAVRKGVGPRKMVEAGQMVKQSEIQLSVTVISGLGGKEQLEVHAHKTAEVLNLMQPDYLSLLTLLVRENTQLEADVELGRFELLSSEEILFETKLIIEDLDLNECIFRANHASNYLSLKGVLNMDKGKLLQQINWALEGKTALRPDYFRTL